MQYVDFCLPAWIYFFQNYLEKEIEPTNSVIKYIYYSRRLGPLIRHWCMRFEANNSYFKRLSNGMFNFKNLPKSLAFRHQKLQCYHLAEEGGYLRTFVEIGSGRVQIKCMCHYM